MGVKDVWLLSGPCEERLSLHELRGKTLAVDLAGWVVSNITAPGQHTVVRPHLRNLFFRTQTLLTLDILPVFVLDGAVAPKAKAATQQARNAATWGTKIPAGSPKQQVRKQLNAVLRDCANLLSSLGVPCITAVGEAEGFCAALDRAGVVDGVISDDSDSLCYGARIVYRHFSADPKNFSVSRYVATRLESELGLSRERMVGMAVLLGSDFNPGGVAGVGREAVVKMFGMWGPPRKGDLGKITSWTGEEEDFDEVIEKKPVHCGSCGHPGSVGQHRKSGCVLCSGDCQTGIDCDCRFHSEDNQKKLAETVIWRKATSTPGWPFQAVTEEFYHKPQLDVSREGVVWTRPQPGAFIKATMGRMDWIKDYAVEKVIPVVVRWQVRNVHAASPIVTPNHIIKKRIASGEPVLEVEWTCHDSSLPPTIVACVPTTDFNEAYPTLLQQYEDMLQQAKDAKKKPKTRAKKAEKENLAPKEKKSRKKKEALSDQPAIDNFLKKDDGGCDLNSADDQKIELAKPKTAKLLVPKKVIKPKEERKVYESPLRNMLSSRNVENILDEDLKSGSEIISKLASNFGNVSLSHGEYEVTETFRSNAKGSDIFSDIGSDYDVDDDNYDSDMSDIIDEIMGKKTNVKGSLEIDILTKKVGEINILVETSTPLEAKFCVSDDLGAVASSPYLKSDLVISQKTPNPAPTSDSPNLKKSAIFQLNDEDFEDSLDEFDMALGDNTNLFDRLKKKLAS